MALPFVLGLAVGATAVIAYNKSDKLKDFIGLSVDKTQKNIEELKDTLIATKECISNKKDELKEETEDIVEEVKQKVAPKKTTTRKKA